MIHTNRIREGSSNSVPLWGLVLAGGRSSRMGSDKGLIEFYGIPQREYVFNLLSRFCRQVFLSCRDDQDIPEKLNPVTDKFEMEGPLNGILSAFQLNPDCAWLTIPVDMPLINDATLQHLIANRNISCAATCFFDSEGKNPEPLVTLWEPAAYPKLLAFYKSGQTSPRNFLKQANSNIIFPPTKNILININSPEELKKFQVGFF